MKAEILLRSNRDKEGYTNCFTNLVERDPSSKNYGLLADAYLRILNPEAAVHALEIAYDKDPSNSRLRARIGRALTATHEYHRALKFYESAIRDVSKVDQGCSEAVGLSQDLARLYVKLGRMTDSEKVLRGVLHTATDAADMTDMQHDVTTLLLLAEVQLHGIIDIHSSVTSLMSSEFNKRRFNSEESARLRDAGDTLQSAYDTQKEVVDRSRAKLSSVSHQSANSSLVGIEKRVLSDICFRSGVLSTLYIDSTKEPITGKGSPSALFDEALQLDPHNVKAMMGLSYVYKASGELTKCSSLCKKIVIASVSVSEEAEASILLSEVLFLQSTRDNVRDLDNFKISSGSSKRRSSVEDIDGEIQEFKSLDDSVDGSEGKSSHETSSSREKSSSYNDKPSKDEGDFMPPLSEAMHPLEQLLVKHPNNYRALERIISLSRRLGRLQEIPAYISAAFDADGRAATHPGYHYCKGLYARCINDVGSAIVGFNMARRDDDWGCSALEAMIDLYLNPNQESSLAWEERESGPMDDASANNLSAAVLELDEERGKSVNPRRLKVLENYCLRATRSKSHVQLVLESFIEILEDDQDYLPAILGLATAYMVDKEPHKAKNLLKRIAKLAPHQHDGEDFAKANLLIAKLNVEKGKYDTAQDAIKKVLSQNRSSSAAWELMGLVMEKEQDYTKASECYERAWSLNFEASATVGFKLAFCYMNSKKFIQAIEICEKVLAEYPEYPKIKEEILNKCVDLLSQ
jgi:tetratricopeptide (TPR) repeat protein